MFKTVTCAVKQTSRYAYVLVVCIDALCLKYRNAESVFYSNYQQHVKLSAFRKSKRRLGPPENTIGDRLLQEGEY